MPIPKDEPCVSEQCARAGVTGTEGDVEALAGMGITVGVGEKPDHAFRFHKPNGYGQMPCGLCDCPDFTMA